MPSAATVYQTLNLIAITCAALSGSTAARRRGLDPVGILSCACISGLRAPFCASPPHAGRPGASCSR